MNTELIKCIAIDNGWEISDRQPDDNFIRFIKKQSIIDIWYSTGTVRYITEEKTYYYRDNTEGDYNSIFKNKYE